MSFWKKLFGGGEPEPIRQRSTGGTASAPADEGELLYSIAEKPMPQGEDPNHLLPVQVGSFVREPIKPAAKGMPIYANYARGAATIFVELGVCMDANDARMALEIAKGETSGEFPDSPQAYAKRGDNSCWSIVDPGGAFFAWTRGRYYFSAHAKGGERALEEFVKGFPY